MVLIKGEEPDQCWSMLTESYLVLTLLLCGEIAPGPLPTVPTTSLQQMQRWKIHRRGAPPPAPDCLPLSGEYLLATICLFLTHTGSLLWNPGVLSAMFSC